MMNHCVPDFQEVEDEFSIPTSSGLSNSRPKRTAIGEEEIMELLWQNGQVVTQTQKSSKRAPTGDGYEPVIMTEQREIRPGGGEEEPAQQHLFMQENEMASWLQYPLDVSSFDRDLYAEFLSSAPPPSTPPIITIASPRPVVDIRIAAPQIQASQRLQNFPHISQIPTRLRNESGMPMSGVATGMKNARALTVVGSNETPVVGQVSHSVEDSKVNVPERNVESGPLVEARELAAGPAKFTVTSSPSCSGESFSAGGDRRPPLLKSSPEDRKRKGREAGYIERPNEETEFQATEAKPQARSSTSTKKSRAAEVHNQSERRRRDRINEKMKALQELIPRCNKSDKASMLDEAIEYLKSLQLQVQMMSMGCGMVPMMYPGMQQYMPVMGMGMGMGLGLGMGMGMGMDMSLNRPMVPYPSMLPGSALPNPAAAAPPPPPHMSACFPMPIFHLPPVPVPDHSRIQASNQTDPTPNSAVARNPNQPQMPKFNEPYQQFLGTHEAPPLSQNQTVVESISKQPSNSKDIGNP